MLDNKYVRVACCVLGASVASEMFYHYIKTRPKIKSDDINTVLFTNDKTQLCTFLHKSKNPKCTNKFCFRINLNRVVQAIDEAVSNISIAMYIFTLNELSDALLRAQKRGVIIRIISDESMAYSSGSRLTELDEAEIAIRFQCTGTQRLMHHKFCIIDGLETEINSGKSLLLTGSMNWTMQAFAGNWDNILISSNKDLVMSYQTEFDRMWEDFNREKNNDDGQ